MAREDDIDPAGAAPVLKGLARDLAATLRDRAEAFMAKAAAESAPAENIDQVMRAITAIARAASAVHALQAAEDKAAARALNAKAERAASAVRARKPNPDEGDETDMDERDPRLDTPEGVAEIRQDARQGLERFFQRLEAKRADRPGSDPGDGPRSPGAVEKLAPEGAPAPAPA